MCLSDSTHGSGGTECSALDLAEEPWFAGNRRVGAVGAASSEGRGHIREFQRTKDPYEQMRIAKAPPSTKCACLSIAKRFVFKNSFFAIQNYFLRFVGTCRNNKFWIGTLECLAHPFALHTSIWTACSENQMGPNVC